MNKPIGFGIGVAIIVAIIVLVIAISAKNTDAGWMFTGISIVVISGFITGVAIFVIEAYMKHHEKIKKKLEMHEASYKTPN